MTAQWAVRTANGLRPQAKSSPSAPAKRKALKSLDFRAFLMRKNGVLPTLLPTRG